MPLYVADRWQYASGEAIGGSGHGRVAQGARFVKLRVAEPLALGLGSREPRLGPGADRFALVLGDGGQNMQREAVGLREVTAHEVNLAVHERGDEGDVAREPIELRNDQLGLVLFAGGKRSGQLGAI